MLIKDLRCGRGLRLPAFPDQAFGALILVPPQPLSERWTRFAALQADDAAVPNLKKQLHPAEPLPRFCVHSEQSNWKRCLLTAHIIAGSCSNVARVRNWQHCSIKQQLLTGALCIARSGSLWMDPGRQYAENSLHLAKAELDRLQKDHDDHQAEHDFHIGL